MARGCTSSTRPLDERRLRLAGRRCRDRPLSREPERGAGDRLPPDPGERRAAAHRVTLRIADRGDRQPRRRDAARSRAGVQSVPGDPRGGGRGARYGTWRAFVSKLIPCRRRGIIGTTAATAAYEALSARWFH